MSTFPVRFNKNSAALRHIMRSISKKSDIKIIAQSCIKTLKKEGVKSAATKTERLLLNCKVRFPLIEFFSEEVCAHIEAKQQVEYMRYLAATKTIGANVVCGKMLQLRLSDHYTECFELAAEFIITGGEWYSSDIIGERVMGVALLRDATKTIPVLQQLLKHNVNWVARTAGVASHYATKKGLEKQYAEELLLLFLQHAATKDHHIKTGLGWGAKTIAKFHPDLMEKHNTLLNSAQTPAWMKYKIGIGLANAAYLKKKRAVKKIKS